MQESVVEADVSAGTPSEPALVTMDSIEYWEQVRSEIITMLNEYDLYVSYIDSAYPCVQFHVEPGRAWSDGTIVAYGLSQAEYSELRKCVIEELHVILDKYCLAKPKTIFHACDSIVGIYFNNWFIDKNKVVDNVLSLQMATYELDLLEYYYEYDEGYFLHKDAFSETIWEKYTVYKPKGS